MTSNALPQSTIRTALLPLRLEDGRKIWAKNETEQHSGAFKFRGSFHYLGQLVDSVSEVVTASTGNHASGLSLAAKIYGMKAIIFVPKATPQSKLQRIKNAGAEIRLVDGQYEEALALALEYANSGNALFIPSYDHPEIIAGNRKIYDEIEETLGHQPTNYFIQIGGGGIISGAISKYQNMQNPPHLVGVEFAPFERVEAILSGQTEEIAAPPEGVPPAVEGIAIRTIGQIPKSYMQNDPALEFQQVSYGEMCSAAKWLYDQHNVKAELGGVAGLAAAMQNTQWQDEAVVVITGGNVDDDVFQRILSGN